MLKKLLLGTLLVGLIAILVVGAIIRTMDKNGDTSQAVQGDQNQTHAVKGDRINQRDVNHKGGQSSGGGRSAATNNEQYANYQETIDDWVTYDGIVSQVPAAGVELVVETINGESVVGTGPLSLAELGLAVQINDAI